MMRLIFVKRSKKISIKCLKTDYLPLHSPILKPFSTAILKFDAYIPSMFAT
jgi:hypothetical protein